MTVKMKAGSATLQLNVKCEPGGPGNVPDVHQTDWLFELSKARGQIFCMKVGTTSINVCVPGTNSISFILTLLLCDCTKMNHFFVSEFMYGIKFQVFLGMFRKSWNVPISFVMSLCVSTLWKNPASTVQIITKFDI
jgi:hypothetical protein